MNENFNQEINLALMKQVERAVRPIPAGKKRKLQMREELLAHLTAIFQEELPRQPDEAAALAAALDRFGKPEEISAELSRGVTWMQRLTFGEEQLGRFIGRWSALRSEDSLLRYSLHALSLIGLLAAFTFLAFLGLLWIFQTRYDPLFLPLTIKLAAHSVISFLLYFWAVRAVERTWFVPPRERDWKMGILTTLGWLVTFTAMSFAAWYLITGNMEDSLTRIPRFFLGNMLCSMTTVFLMAWFFHDAKVRNKPYEAWTRLELEE